ncbi:MAG: hypothetical protein KatS3mg038_1149 [Candidatus Kapaibacterium sp.]|nr:MAG: hypothetical protein KatS3mg038_1149 [Candidatus Kapabacteria bacterium]
MASVVGGGRQLVVYTMTRGATPSIGATPVFSLTAQIKTTVNVNYTQSHEVDIEHVEDSQALYAFLRHTLTRLRRVRPKKSPTRTAPSNPIAVRSSALLADLCAVATSGAARKIYTAACVIDPTSGAWSQEGNKYNATEASSS